MTHLFLSMKLRHSKLVLKFLRHQRHCFSWHLSGYMSEEEQGSASFFCYCVNNLTHSRAELNNSTRCLHSYYPYLKTPGSHFPLWEHPSHLLILKTVDKHYCLCLPSIYSAVPKLLQAKTDRQEIGLEWAVWVQLSLLILASWLEKHVKTSRAPQGDPRS